MRFQKGKAKILSGVLFSSTLFLFNQAEVLALAPTNASPSPSTSVPVTSIPTPVASSTTTNFIPTSSTAPSTNIVTPAPTVPNQTYTGDKPLDSAITDASSQGISVVEAPGSSVPTTTAQKTDYNNQTTIITDVTKQYVADKAVYASQDKAYQDYLTKQGQYQKDMASYQAYLKAKAVYDQQMKVYNTAKANYDMTYNQALVNTNKTGYLPEVLAQNLIFRLEPNATQTITGKLLSDADLAKATKDSNGWIDPGTIIGNPKLATLTTKNKWNSALVSVGETVVVDYTGLENSSFSGHALTHVRYTYKLISTTHYSGKVVFQAIADPTETSYTHIYNKDGKTRSSFEFQMTVQLFDAQGNEMIPTASNYALTSFASLNSRNGNGEYVRNYNGRFIPINGSTISVENGKAANFSSTDQATTIAGWDDKNSPDAYIGAIVGQSTDRISFNFGNTHGFADWFAFNSDVKTSGGIVRPPILPTAPKAVAKPIKPTAVAQPSAIPTPIIYYHRVRVVAPLAITSKPLKVKPTYVTSPTTYHYSPVMYYFAPPVKNYGSIYRAPMIGSNDKKVVKTITQPLTEKKGSQTREKAKKNKSLSKDIFGDNTGIRGNNQKAFLDYIHDVATQAKKDYKKLKNKKGISQKDYINHAIANALAIDVYGSNFLQTKANDFGKAPEANKYGRKVIKDTHNDKNGFLIDLPHIGAARATAEKSRFYKELIKLIMSYSPNGVGTSSSDIIFLLNSEIGDKIQEERDKGAKVNKVDKNSDIDGFILKYHPDYKNLPLDRAIEKYYNSKRLTDDVRNKLYNQAIKDYEKTSPDTVKHNKNSAKLSIGGLAIKYNVFIKERIFGKYKYPVMIAGGLIGIGMIITKTILPLIAATGLVVMATERAYTIRKKVGKATKVIKKVWKKYVPKPVKRFIKHPIKTTNRVFNKYIKKPFIKLIKRQTPARKNLKSNYRPRLYRKLPLVKRPVHRIQRSYRPKFHPVRYVKRTYKSMVRNVKRFFRPARPASHHRARRRRHR